MKHYKRTDGFEVQDSKDRPVEWAVETYGGDFVEVQSTVLTAEEISKVREVAKHKAFLEQTDYKILKKLEKLLPADDVDVIERQEKRNRINELERPNEDFVEVKPDA